MMVGLLLRSVRVFEQFSWLGIDSDKIALSRPAHQQVTQTVGCTQPQKGNYGNTYWKVLVLWKND